MIPRYYGTHLSLSLKKLNQNYSLCNNQKKLCSTKLFLNIKCNVPTKRQRGTDVERETETEGQTLRKRENQIEGKRYK